MRLLLALALGLSACGGKTTTPKPPGDPAVAGDPGATGDTVAGDPIAGDPVAGDPIAGDPLPGDPIAGDPFSGDPIAGDPLATTAITPSTQLCAAGGKVSSPSYKGTVCLSPLGSGGQVSTSTSYKWIPGPAHIVEGE